MQGMNSIGNGLAYTDFSKFGRKQRNNNSEALKSKKQENTNGAKNAPELSKSAQNLLDKIKEKYADMDVFVADFNTDEEANDILARGTTAFSLLISPDELEKMASDEKYADEKLGAIDDALEMGKKIDQEYGLDKALEEDGDSTVVRSFGITINSDGTTSVFAQLEQISAKQKEHIRSIREKRAKEQAKEDKKIDEKRAEKIDEKKDALKKLDKIKSDNWAHRDFSSLKKIKTVFAASYEELRDKINNVNFDKVKAEPDAGKIDFSV